VTSTLRQKGGVSRWGLEISSKKEDMAAKKGAGRLEAGKGLVYEGLKVGKKGKS